LLSVLETRADPSAIPGPFLPSITFLLFSSLLTSEKTSPIEGRVGLPIILPITSLNSTLSPARNLKMRLSSSLLVMLSILGGFPLIGVAKVKVLPKPLQGMKIFCDTVLTLSHPFDFEGFPRSEYV